MAKHQARPFKDFRDDDHFCNVAVAVCTGTCVAIKLSLGTLYTHTCSCSVVDSKDTHTHTKKAIHDIIKVRSHQHTVTQYHDSTRVAVKKLLFLLSVYIVLHSIFISILLIYFVQLLKLKRDS